MKLGDEALLGIMACLRKALVEGIDITSLLKEMELTVAPDGRLVLDPSSDPWKQQVKDFWD